jgi:hypothetical protein
LPEVFVSYSREDQVAARHFAEGFESEGFSVWWDQALHPGEAFGRQRSWSNILPRDGAGIMLLGSFP